MLFKIANRLFCEATQLKKLNGDSTWANPEGHSLLDRFETALDELRSLKTPFSSIEAQHRTDISSLRTENKKLAVHMKMIAKTSQV
jgi:hypothetical protein